MQKCKTPNLSVPQKKISVQTLKRETQKPNHLQPIKIVSLFCKKAKRKEMTCKGCLECLFKLLNYLLTLVGLAMIGYGSYLFFEFKPSSNEPEAISPTGEDVVIQFGRPIIMAVVSFPDGIFDNLPKAWFIYLFIGVGVTLFVISCFGCIGAATRNGCCLTCVSLFSTYYTLSTSLMQPIVT